MMGEAKWTPGPWTATPFSSVVGCPITAQPDPKRNTVVLAGVHGAFGDDYRAEVEANAHLIAAAPALYEALEMQERLASLQIEGDPRDAIILVREKRRAALALARGETP